MAAAFTANDSIFEFDPVPDLVGNPSMQMLDFLDFGDDEDSAAESVSVVSGGLVANWQSPKTVSDNHTPSPASIAPPSPLSYNPSDFGGFDFSDEKKPLGGPATMMEDIQIKQEPMQITPAQAPIQHPQPQQLGLGLPPVAALPASQQEALQQLLASFVNYQSQYGLGIPATDVVNEPTAGPSTQVQVPVVPAGINPSLLATTPTASTPTTASFTPSTAASAPSIATPAAPVMNVAPCAPVADFDEPLVAIQPGEMASPGPNRSVRSMSTFSASNDDNIESRIDQLVPLTSIFSAGRGKGGKKGGGMSSVVRGDDEELDDDDSWRPSPEEYKKLSSKEKRQLRNKLSARAFRTRRKDYIGTLESHIKDRDSVIDAIRAELSNTRSENQDLRRELEALKASTMAVLHPESADKVGESPSMMKALAETDLNAAASAPQKASVRRTTTPTVNTRKDVAPFASGSSFWGGADNMFGGGNTVCHTTLTPEIMLPPQPNLNPLLNGASDRGDKHTSLHVGDRDIDSSSFADWATETPFSLRSMDNYRMQLWSRLAREAAADKANVPVSMRPKFYIEPKGASSTETSALSALAATATEHVASKLTSSFWSALSGPSAKLDADKLAAVVTGKSRLVVVPNNDTKAKSSEDALAHAMAGLKVATGAPSPAESLRVRENPLAAMAGFFKPQLPTRAQ